MPKTNKKISPEMTHAAYIKAKDVFHDRMTLKDAIEQLESNDRMSKGSATDYINNFKKMMMEEDYARTYNIYATDYILSQILIDYGIEQYEKAISSVRKHVKYYNKLGKGRLKEIEEVILPKHEKELKKKRKAN